MQVSTHVKEAIDEVALYSALEHKPDISEGLIQGGELADFESTLDSSFFNVFNQTCGYYQLKRFSATCNEAVKLSFIEDVTEYRLTEDPALRLMRWVGCSRPLPHGGCRCRSGTPPAPVARSVTAFQPISCLCSARAILKTYRAAMESPVGVLGAPRSAHSCDSETLSGGGERRSGSAHSE
jgi:hypothetical protein